MPAGTRMSFDFVIIDDNVAEYFNEGIRINLGKYESDEMVVCDNDYVYIEDNDGNNIINKYTVEQRVIAGYITC